MNVAIWDDPRFAISVPAVVAVVPTGAPWMELVLIIDRPRGSTSLA